MNKFYLIVTLLTIQLFWGQEINPNTEMKGMREMEIKSFAGKISVGKANPNTLNYDLQYQRMDVALDPAVQYISGSVTSHFKTKQSINKIYFDLSDALLVSKVQYHGASLTFQQLSTQEIKIDFPACIPKNTLDSLTISYSGAPVNAAAFLLNNQSGTPVLSTLSQPYGARDWFPTKQSLNDKIEKFDFKITTPSQYSVAANGKLMSEKLLPGKKKLTFWRTKYPMAAYLAGISITNFVKKNDVIGNPPFPFVNYVFPAASTNTAIMANIEWTKQAMDLFETYFGAYPFRNEKYGHMEFKRGGAMEHQTMSTMGDWSKSVVAHELAHQWFGDKVTCGKWNDLWINEGFAAFGVHLANEKLLMTNSQFMSYLYDQIDYITSIPDGSTYIPDSGLTDTSRIFDMRLTYTKGGYILRMLKWILGDAAFYQALKEYHSRPGLAYNYVETSDLNASLLQSTGKDFTEFFNDWIYGEGYPTYEIKWKQTGNQILFNVAQTQSSSSVSFFEMPLPIKVTGTRGQNAYLVLNNTSNNQNFSKAVSFPVASIQFNYEYQIIERNSTVTQDNTLSVSPGKQDEFVLYPNPAKNELYLKGINKPTEFLIHMTNGKLVEKGQYEPGKMIGISKLLPGTYVLTIDNKNVKFVKQ